MIGTHAVKNLYPIVPQEALAADIIADVPSHFICSKTIEIKQKYWAMPTNAADMKQAKAELESLSGEYHYIPDIQSPRLLQILLPYKGDYVAAMPVLSAGVIYEIFSEFSDKEKRFKYLPWVTRPIPTSRIGCGQNIVMQGGMFKLFKLELPKLDMEKKISVKDECIAITFHAEHMNVSGGMVAFGIPAMTAVGGFVHMLERAFGDSIDFAVGYRNIHSNFGVKKSTRLTGKKVSSLLATQEIIANGYVTVLLKSTNNKRLLNFLQKQNIIKRFCGGTAWNVEIKRTTDGDCIDPVHFVYNPTEALADTQQHYSDSLRHALAYYSNQQIQKEHETDAENVELYSINHTGYAFLEEPILREWTRFEYPCSWTESIYSLIGVKNDYASDIWWKRCESENLVYWN